MSERMSSSLTLFIVLFSCCVFINPTLSSPVPLTMLTHPTAKCMDGTQAGYYYQPSTNTNDARKWVIYLNGGGECDNEVACKGQLTNALGSSKYFENTSEASGWYFGSDYCPYNPKLCGWNHVMDPYCSQDLHSGQVLKPSDATWGLYFSGHLILKATLDALDVSAKLRDATDIVVSGASAGGIGVWMNVDYIAKRYPKARVTALTVAGHYFYATYYNGPNYTNPGSMADFREAAFDNSFNLYKAFVDEDCEAAYVAKGKSPGACMLSNNSFPFISADSFVVQSQTDCTVLEGHDCFPGTYKYEAPEQEFMQQWHANMTQALAPLMKTNVKGSPRHGVFAAACYIHGGFTHSSPLINGISYNTAFNNFYFESTDESGYKLQDDCGVMCNPTCST